MKSRRRRAEEFGLLRNHRDDDSSNNSDDEAVSLSRYLSMRVAAGLTRGGTVGRRHVTSRAPILVYLHSRCSTLKRRLSQGTYMHVYRV